jgi:hypothetical protein
MGGGGKRERRGEGKSINWMRLFSLTCDEIFLPSPYFSFLIFSNEKFEE